MNININKVVALLLCLTATTFISQPKANQSIAAVTTYLDTRVINPERIPAEDPNANAADDPETDSWLNNEEILKKLEINDKITPETTDLLGEQINLDTGTLSFSHTDVSLPGNFNLPVAITRSYKGRQSMLSSDLAMGDWLLEVPMITTNIMGSHSFGYSGPWGQGQACSLTHTDAWTGAFGRSFMPNEYWNGDIITIPGQINESLIFNNGKIIDQNQYKRITKSGWRVKCTIEASGTEGFEVHSPDGTVYTLNVPRLVYMGKLKYNNRFKAYLLASKVEDRFGNTVTYSYGAQTRLTKIEASDGRIITLEYHNDQGQPFTAI